LENDTKDAVTCRNCSAMLPADCQFCPRCGHAVPAAEGAYSSGTGECSHCGAITPATSQFCPQCGQMATGVSSRRTPALPRPKKRYPAVWFLVPIVIVLVAWALFDNPHGIQELQRLANLSHDQTITPAAVSIVPHGFASYRFTVPAGARNVTVTGEFEATAVHPVVRDDGLEIYLLTESDLVNWQYGYSPNAFFSSGRVKQGEIDAALPAGAGTYCLVFNNNFSSRTAKSVHASVILHYNKWWPIS
jgi:RNA polymerase subunit RPABC4/transcription elongation factor Spt4